MSGTVWPYPRWVAHRGAGKLAPENTLAAFRLGAQYGFRMFECDVKLSRDGVPFLLHDTDLARTTAVTGIAGEREWSELSRLDAGAWHSRAYAGEPLPPWTQSAASAEPMDCSSTSKSSQARAWRRQQATLWQLLPKTCGAALRYRPC